MVTFDNMEKGDSYNSLWEMLIEDYRTHGINVGTGKKEIISSPVFVANDFVKLISLYKKKDFETFSSEVNKHKAFIDALNIVKDHNQENYDFYIKTLLTCNDELAVYGYKFEIIIYSTFVKKGLEFEKTDNIGNDKASSKPDFKILGYGKAVVVECTSIRKKDTEISTYVKKMEKSISKKSKKEYASTDVVLFIDITNAKHNFLRSGISASKLIQSLPENLGAIITFFYKQTPNKTVWSIEEIKINLYASPSLRLFLERNLSKGNTDAGSIPMHF